MRIEALEEAMRFVGFHVLLLVLTLSSGACQCDRDESKPSAVVGERSTVEVPAALEPAPVDGEKEVKPAPHPMRKPRRPIFIGGCRDLCYSASDAMSSFLKSVEAADVDAVVSLLESSLLKFDGENLGPRWVEMWRNGNLDERKREIRATAEGIVSQLKSGALWQGKLDNETKRSAEILARSSAGGALRFHLYKRGLEWLVSEIVVSP